LAEADDLDALVRRVDPDRWLSSRFIADAEKRADVIGLYAFDYELARASKVTSNPLIAEIRLTWWREALDEIFAGGLVRGHPAARALARAVRDHALPRPLLEAMIDARIEMLERGEVPLATALVCADELGGSVAALASAILDPASPAGAARTAGSAWWLLTAAMSGLAVDAERDDGLRRSLEAAKESSRRVSVTAFPAIAHLAVRSRDLRGGRPPALVARLRILRSVLQGHL
jgi:phytoene synthase